MNYRRKAKIIQGQFVVIKTGVHPMRVKLKLFYKWGIQFIEDKPYPSLIMGTERLNMPIKKRLSMVL